MKDPVTHAIDEQVNSKRIEEVDDCLTPTDQLLLSIAVSMKRIADAVDGTTLGRDISESLAGLTLKFIERERGGL
jgi:hypothetical protein